MLAQLPIWMNLIPKGSYFKSCKRKIYPQHPVDNATFKMNDFQHSSITTWILPQKKKNTYKYWNSLRKYFTFKYIKNHRSHYITVEILIAFLATAIGIRISQFDHILGMYSVYTEYHDSRKHCCKLIFQALMVSLALN